MMLTRTLLKRWFVALVAFGFLAVACGQYKNVHNAVAAGGAASEGDTGLTTSTGTGTSTIGGTDLGGGTISGGDTSTSGGSISGGTDTSGTGGTDTSGTGGGDTSTSGGGSSEAPPTSGDSTGVTDSTITIGIHAPLTGAAPVREDSFNEGKDLYWNYGDNGKPVKINGRTVKVVFQDDHYNPSTAKSVCQKMAEEDHAFLLIGGAGTDQIQSCAQYAASRGIPYLSAGVTEIGLGNLDNYFALSMTYPDQAPLVAQEIKNRLHVTDPSKVAIVATDTANFDDAVNAFTQAFPGVKVFRPSKNENGSSQAASLCTGTVKLFDVVFPLVAPTYYLQMAKAADCHPQYVGIGITQGIDTVANIGCGGDNATQNAMFLSPYPAWEDRQKYDPTFEKAVAAATKDRGSFTDDDIVWLLWNLSRAIGELLQAAGPNLTREGFIYSTERANVTDVPGYPDNHFTPDDHFGASTAANLINVCKQRGDAAGYYVTKDDYRSSF